MRFVDLLIRKADKFLTFIGISSTCKPLYYIRDTTDDYCRPNLHSIGHAHWLQMTIPTKILTSNAKINSNSNLHVN